MEYAQSRGRDPEFVLERLRYGSFVSLRHRYVYLETPKTACTEMKHFITELEKAPCDLDQRPYWRKAVIERNEMIEFLYELLGNRS